MPENSRSTVVHIRLVENSAIATMNGASDVSMPGIGVLPKREAGHEAARPEVQRQRQSRLRHTAHNGSQ